MTRAYMKSLIDDGMRLWMTPLEAAVYTGASPAEVLRALISDDLAGVQTPGGGLTDCLLARDELDQWLERRYVRGELSR